MRDLVRKPRNIIALTLVIAVAAALLVSLFSSSSTNLPSYTGPSEIEPPAATAAPSPTVETRIYENPDYGFSMPVPAEWTFVTKNGADSYAGSDGAIISFSVSDYDPALNLITKDTVTSDIASLNGLLGGFAWLSTSSYIVIYEVNSIDCFELVTWDLDTLVRVLASVPAERYGYYSDTMTLLFDRFVWEKQNPVPDGCFMYYSAYGNFEFPVPCDWDYEIVNGVFTAVSADTQANYRISVSGSVDGFGGISQLDYVNAMSGGKSGYMLSAYANSDTTLSAAATFTDSAGTQYVELHNMLAAGGYHYELLFQCPSEAYESEYETYAKILNHFRVF